MDCVTRTVRNEGLSALYKGTLSPLAGIAFCVSIQFATLEHVKRIFKESNLKAGKSENFTMGQMYIAGGLAGLANSFVSGPVEHIRTRMQVQGAGVKEYSSTLDCFKKIYAKHGISGIYKGQVITMLREWQGFGGYFLVYEYLVQRAKQISGKKVSELPTYEVMTYGALAGYGMWIPVYPVDSIKSRIQTDSLKAEGRKYAGWVDCLRKTLAAEGAGGLYKGFTACMLRAAPVNGTFNCFVSNF